MTGAITSARMANALAGMNAATAKLDRAAASIASGGGDTLVRDAVDLSTAKADFKANAIVLKTEDEMQKSLLHAVDFKA